MKKHSVIVFTLLSLVGLAVGAHAQEEGTVIVTVPFEFVAGGATLPAGTYTVSKTSATNPFLLIYSHSHAAFVLALVFEDALVENLHLSFEHVGDKYLLSQVETPVGTYTIDTHRDLTRLTRVAQMKGRDGMKDGMSSSGTQ